MNRIHRTSLRGLAVLALIGLRVPTVLGGDPVPDADVTVEQVPGAGFAIEVRHPIGFDGDPIPDVDVILEQIPRIGSVILSGDKALGDLSIGQLPSGWGVRRQGRKLVLEGPPLALPVRFQLQATGTRPQQVDVELRGADGKTLGTKRKITPREVPQRVVAGTLTGTVRLPSRVSPGETIALRSLPTANLPAGGRWVISGTVSDPWTTDDLRHARAIVNTTRSHLKTATAAAATPPLTLVGGTCDEMAPLAAVVVGGLAGLEAPLTLAAERATDDAAVASPAQVGTIHKTQHDTNKQIIGNIRFAFAIVIDDEDAPAISIKEQGVKEEPMHRVQPSQASAPQLSRRPGDTEAWTLGTAGRTVRWEWQDPAALARLPAEKVQLVALDSQAIADGCRFAPREPNELDLLHWARMQAHKPDRGGRPDGKPAKEALHLLTLPDDLRAGDRLSIRYLDEWGDPWVDVPQVEDVEVVPPSPERAPTLDSASAYAVGGEPVCVCGRFGPADIVAPFVLGGRTVEAVSASRDIVWLQTPTDALGPAAITAEGLEGRVTTDLLRARAELDQANLFSGQSTPLRIVVEGTERNLPIRLTNASPQVIQLEGGTEQTTETTGGSPNQVLRQVQGLERGSFNLSWEVLPAKCPCTGGG